jgi:class 3 adenylate cyclase
LQSDDYFFVCLFHPLAPIAFRISKLVNLWEWYVRILQLTTTTTHHYNQPHKMVQGDIVVDPEGPFDLVRTNSKIELGIIGITESETSSNNTNNNDNDNNNTPRLHDPVSNKNGTQQLPLQQRSGGVSDGNDHSFQLQPDKGLNSFPRGGVVVLFGLVLLLLCLITLGGAAATYYFITFHETKEDQDNNTSRHGRRHREFQTLANAVLDTLRKNGANHLELYKSMGHHMTTYALGTGDRWPLVHIPHFEAEANFILGGDEMTTTTTTTTIGSASSSSLTVVTLQTLVTQSERLAFEQYMTTSFIRSEEEEPSSSSSSSSTTTTPTTITPYIFDSLDERTITKRYSSPYYAPVSHVSPLAENMPLLNYNAFNDSVFAQVFHTLVETRDAILVPVTHHDDATSILQTTRTTTTTMTTTTTLTGGNSTQQESRPDTCIAIPVYSTLDEGADLVAVLTVWQPWHQLFLAPPVVVPFDDNDKDDDDDDDDSVHGMILVVRNPCAQDTTYQIINGQTIQYLGPGDHHDAQFNDMEVTSAAMDLTTTTSSATHKDCPYSLHLYPSSLVPDNDSVRPLRYTASVTAVLLTIGMGVLWYACRSGRTSGHPKSRRQLRRQVNHNNDEGDAENVLDNHDDSSEGDTTTHHRDDFRIPDDLHNNNNNNNQRNVSSSIAEREPSATLNLALANPPLLRNNSRAYSETLLMSSTRSSHSSSSAAAEAGGSNPPSFADEFKDASVMFADIDGFSSWAAIREPSQVFILLAAAYNAFDRIADGCNIFKVETLGDSYVAASGLPDPVADHATVIVRFADDCMKELKAVVDQLAATLGPGTSDLCLRVGIHSGAVVAGVLKGEGKYRFQLLGGAVQIAALMLSTSFKNKIHTSPETARLLIEDEKSEWLMPRYSTVFIKDKECQTYWVSLGTETGTSSTEGKRGFSNYEMAKQELKEASSNENIGGAEVVAVAQANYQGRRGSVGVSGRRSIGMDGAITEGVVGVYPLMHIGNSSSIPSVPQKVGQSSTARAHISPNPSSPPKIMSPPISSPNPTPNNNSRLVREEAFGDRPTRITPNVGSSSPLGMTSVVDTPVGKGSHVDESHAPKTAALSSKAAPEMNPMPPVMQASTEQPITLESLRATLAKASSQDTDADNRVIDTVIRIDTDVNDGSIKPTSESNQASMTRLKEVMSTMDAGRRGSVATSGSEVEDYSVSMSEESDSFDSFNSSDDYSSDDSTIVSDDVLVGIPRVLANKNSTLTEVASTSKPTRVSSVEAFVQQLCETAQQAVPDQNDARAPTQGVSESKPCDSNAHDDSIHQKLGKLRSSADSVTIEKSVTILRNLLKGIVAGRNVMAPGDGTTSWAEEDFGSKRRITVQDDAVEVLTFPKNSVPQTVVDRSSLELESSVETQLMDFVKVVACTYQEHPYHSFERAVSIMESVSRLFSQIVKPDFAVAATAEDSGASYKSKTDSSKLLEFTIGLSCDPLVPFAVAISALVQDICHPGKPSSQRVTGKASLEYAWDLLMEPTYKDLRTSIYASLPERDRFRQLLINSVVAADMNDKDLGELSKKRWGVAFRRRESKDSNATTADQEVDLKTTIVLEHLIQAANVSHAMNDWSTYTKWIDLGLQERSVAPRDGRVAQDPSEELYTEELNFLDRVVLPLIRRLRECDALGAAVVEYLKASRQIRQEWSRKGRELTRASLSKHKVMAA